MDLLFFNRMIKNYLPNNKILSLRFEKSGETLLLFAHDSRILPGIGQQALASVCAHQEHGVKLVNMEDSVVETLCEKLRLQKVEGEEGIYLPEGNLPLVIQLLIKIMFEKRP